MSMYTHMITDVYNAIHCIYEVNYGLLLSIIL